MGVKKRLSERNCLWVTTNDCSSILLFPNLQQALGVMRHRVISKLPAIWLMHLRWDQAEMIIRINDHQDIYRIDEAPAHDSCHVLLYINRIWI